MCDCSSTAPGFAPHKFRSDGENPGADHSISAQLISKHVSRTWGNVQVEHVVRFTAARFKCLRYSRGYSFPPLQFTINDYQPIRIFLFLSLNWWATHFVCPYCLQNGAMDKKCYYLDKRVSKDNYFLGRLWILRSLSITSWHSCHAFLVNRLFKLNLLVAQSPSLQKLLVTCLKLPVLSYIWMNYA